MTEPYPSVDRRRAPELSAELQRTAATMLPEWRGASDPEDVGRALLAIAARLAEHVTGRLDQTPERDWIAFLRFLDTPRQPVGTATVPIVFTVAEGRESPVFVPERTQAAADTGGEKVIFETRQGVSLTPARLTASFAVDPTTDHIEAPPPGFLEPPRPRSATPDYTLASFAAPDSDTVQITPAVGLSAGAVIRIEGHQPVYRIQEDRGEGVFRLLDRLDRPAAQGARVTIVSTFELFRLRNLQDHVVYLGHESLFNVQQPAEITLTITPANAVARLAALNVTYAFWGINDDEQAEEPDWIPLEPVYGNGIVRLQKSWQGSVDPWPLPRSEHQCRWLRIRLGAPIAPLATIGTLTERIGLQVESAVPPPPGNVEGSQTITRALHNFTPLALSTRFFPFGVEPLRFDTFALAAPEALSKHGARVELRFDQIGASPAQITTPYSPLGQRRAYAVTEQGALHVLTLDKSGTIERWQGLGYPAGPDISGAVRLRADFPPLAGPTGPSWLLNDLVVVRARDGSLWSAEVGSTSSGSAEVRRWLHLPALPPDCNLASAILLPKAISIPIPFPLPFVYLSLMFALTDLGLYVLELGGAQLNWTQVQEHSEEQDKSKPDLRFDSNPSAPRPHLVPMLGEDFPQPPTDPYSVVITGADGILWSGTLKSQGSVWAVSWKKLSEKRFSLDVRPAAAGHHGDCTVFSAKTVDRNLVRLIFKNGAANSKDSDFHCNVRSSVLCLPGCNPSAIAFGSTDASPQLALWAASSKAPKVVASPTPLGAAAIFFPSDKTSPPILVQLGMAETLFSTPLKEDTLGQSVVTRFPRNYQNPSLSWEYFDGQGWRRLEDGFTDTTANFEGDGIVSFIVPDDLSPTEISGQTDYWIRARLVGGDYGRPQHIVKTEGTAPNLTQTITVDTSQLNPPEILSIEASYKPAPAQIKNPLLPERVIVENNGTQRDQTQANTAAGAAFELFQGAWAIDPTTADRRALYLGFDQPFDAGTLSFFIDAGERGTDTDLDADVLVGSSWLGVGLQDGTGGLQRRGFSQLSLTQRPTRTALFGNELFWLRLRPRANISNWQPDLRAILINAALAEHAESLSRELLGSSDGSPNQRFVLSRTPVLTEQLGEGLELRVRETRGSDEEQDLDVARYPDPDMLGSWVRWRRVESFVGYDGAARVFLLDPISGEVRFGDNRHGKVPPAGRDGIRVIGYRAGGGVRGNVAAFSIATLKTAIESVERVTNPLNAAGGADPATQEEEISRAPAVIQHRDQAITPRDVEALALVFSRDVVRARCLPPSRANGVISLAVAIRGDERCPPLSLESRYALIAYLRQRGGGVFDAVGLTVSGPLYHQLRVYVQLHVRDLKVAAEVEQEAHRRIYALLDPLKGGPEGGGWPFGRPLRRSDILRVLGDIHGLEKVIEVVIAAIGRPEPDHGLGPTSLICAAARDDVQVSVTGVSGRG